MVPYDPFNGQFNLHRSCIVLTPTLALRRLAQFPSSPRQIHMARIITLASFYMYAS